MNFFLFDIKVPAVLAELNVEEMSQHISYASRAPQYYAHVSIPETISVRSQSRDQRSLHQRLGNDRGMT